MTDEQRVFEELGNLNKSVSSLKERIDSMKVDDPSLRDTISWLSADVSDILISIHKLLGTQENILLARLKPPKGADTTDLDLRLQTLEFRMALLKNAVESNSGKIARHSQKIAALEKAQ